MENSELVKTILLFGGIAGAVTAIITLGVKLVGAIEKVKQYFKDLKDSVDTLVKNDVEQQKAIYKLTVMTENMPLSERINAAKKYMALGGNGEIKAYYEEHLKPHDHISEGE